MLKELHPTLRACARRVGYVPFSDVRTGLCIKLLLADKKIAAESLNRVTHSSLPAAVATMRRRRGSTYHLAGMLNLPVR
jgi:hypothetical protein